MYVYEVLVQTHLPILSNFTAPLPPNVINQVTPTDTCEQLGRTSYPHVQGRSVKVEVACSSAMLVPLYPRSATSPHNLEDSCLDASSSVPYPLFIMYQLQSDTTISDFSPRGMRREGSGEE